ncbi:MAG: bifunctional phosphoglucose/phosphomannose isomerase [Syntrophomonadaceae bacterium]
MHKQEASAQRMMNYLYNLPEQFKQVLQMDLGIAGSGTKYNHILVSGLGGSGIGGDILRTFALQEARIPVIVNRDYNIPQFADSNTLAFITSYSGNTEETLGAYQQAKSRGARIICITSGGSLEKMAINDGYELLKIPGGLVPRAANGYLFAPMVLALEKLGLVSGAREQLEETVQVMERIRQSLTPDVDKPDNPAKAIAAELKDSLPIIWATQGISETAAMRWKGQINENAKAPAYYNVFPELNHNEIVGFKVPSDLLSRVVVVLLTDKYDHPRIKKRIEITRNVVKNQVKNIIEVNSEGESFLARLYSLIYIGDYSSVYLAYEYGLDPTPVEVIDYLKAELGKVV